VQCLIADSSFNVTLVNGKTFGIEKDCSIEVFGLVTDQKPDYIRCTHKKYFKDFVAATGVRSFETDAFTMEVENHTSDQVLLGYTKQNLSSL